MFKVQVYGGGSSKSRQLRIRVHNALWMLGLRDFEVEVEGDERKYPEGVSEAPAIGVDGNILSVGALPEIVDIQKMLVPFIVSKVSTHVA
jgi:hypothetical protein